ncbi:hypothetical protein SAMN04488550_4566 [Gordonia malaquae]|nr:hypothetical protein SAMN04488550_0582 [Gordonia malaquae]SEE57234.1 hypothetical protein SAMN04488550_4566 [Gordonia malaquae]
MRSGRAWYVAVVTAGRGRSVHCGNAAVSTPVLADRGLPTRCEPDGAQQDWCERGRAMRSRQVRDSGLFHQACLTCALRSPLLLPSCPGLPRSADRCTAFYPCSSKAVQKAVHGFCRSEGGSTVVVPFLIFKKGTVYMQVRGSFWSQKPHLYRFCWHISLTAGDSNGSSPFVDLGFEKKRYTGTWGLRGALTCGYVRKSCTASGIQKAVQRCFDASGATYVTSAPPGAWTAPRRHLTGGSQLSHHVRTPRMACELHHINAAESYSSTRITPFQRGGPGSKDTVSRHAVPLAGSRDLRIHLPSALGLQTLQAGCGWRSMRERR